MADKIQIAYGLSGKTLDAIIRAKDATVWDGTTLVTYVSANYTSYVIPLTESGTSGFYSVDVPSSLPAGYYNVEISERVISGTPAETDGIAGNGDLSWNGTAIIYLDDFVSAPKTLTSTERAFIADQILNRNLGGGMNGGRTVQDALRVNRNKIAFNIPVDGQFTVYCEDDITPAFTGTYSRGPNNLGPLLITDPI